MQEKRFLNMESEKARIYSCGAELELEISKYTRGFIYKYRWKCVCVCACACIRAPTQPIPLSTERPEEQPPGTPPEHTAHQSL